MSSSSGTRTPASSSGTRTPASSAMMIPSLGRTMMTPPSSQSKTPPPGPSQTDLDAAKKKIEDARTQVNTLSSAAQQLQNGEQAEQKRIRDKYNETLKTAMDTEMAAIKTANDTAAAAIKTANDAIKTANDTAAAEKKKANEISLAAKTAANQTLEKESIDRRTAIDNARKAVTDAQATMSTAMMDYNKLLGQKGGRTLRKKRRKRTASRR